jgi:IS5 family transposase
MLTLHALRIELGQSYRQTIDLLSEMPGVLEEIGLMRVPHFTVLCDWFEKLPTPLWRAFLRATAEKRTGHAAVDSTGFDRDQPSRYYAQRAHYRVRSLKVTALVDIVTLCVIDVHCTTTKKHDAKIGPQVARRNAGDLLSLAADRGYDAKTFRDEFWANGVRPLIKHRIYSSLDHAHNAHIDSDKYNRRWMVAPSQASSARSAPACVREAGISNSVK